jgi:hypothetical protein
LRVGHFARGGADKNFENLGAKELPTFTDPPNRLFQRTVPYFDTLGVLFRVCRVRRFNR